MHCLIDFFSTPVAAINFRHEKSASLRFLEFQHFTEIVTETVWHTVETDAGIFLESELGCRAHGRVTTRRTFAVTQTCGKMMQDAVVEKC